MNAIAVLEKNINYSFQDKSLLETALTHSSANNKSGNYERLEFLGDRVLGLVIANFLYAKFPDESEGDLAKRLASLVQGSTLAKLSARIELAKFIQLSPSERDSGGAENEHILADVFESLIGAMYLDGGFDPCKTLIETQWADVFYTMKTPPQHPKTALQEWAQAKSLPLPLYEIAEQTGPDHAPTFEIRLSVKGYDPITASGRSRAEAEKQAARIFMKQIEENHD